MPLRKEREMDNLQETIRKIAAAEPSKIVLSVPVHPEQPYGRAVIRPIETGYQVERFTEKQAFHENISPERLEEVCLELMAQFRQLNAWAGGFELAVRVTKKGKVLYHRRKSGDAPEPENLAHNRVKKYLLPEGEVIPPLVDMGVFSKEGKVVKPMYHKYRQINRFLEVIDDAVRKQNLTHLNIIDFGCGKSYLTFIVYHYLHNVRGISLNMIGLDLKEDVIKNCNAAAKKYGYENLTFQVGDIGGFSRPFDVDMVLTLHACDTATDYALYNAVQWGSKMIFSVPCCQHELNGQLHTEELSLLTRYGIVGERFAALLTDAIRGNLLEYAGYHAQLLEFVDLSHTPKNILIRAVKAPEKSEQSRQKALLEVKRAMEEFHVDPTLYRLLCGGGNGGLIH